MSVRALGIRSCVDERSHQQPEITNVLTLSLEMSAFVVVLVLLFAARVVITLWNGCAWGTRGVCSMMTPVGRNAFTRIVPWRRAIYVFYLGALGSSTSSQASVSSLPIARFSQQEVQHLHES